MEKQTEINEKIAKNLIYYRKRAGLTQAELAEKINYSDKSVSKWESGNGIPDVYTLIALAELYGVTLDAFVATDTPVQVKRKQTGLHLLITLLSCGIVWLVAVCLFVAMHLLRPEWEAWHIFMYAVVATSIVVLVYASIWKQRVVGFVAVSVLIWMAITCGYLTGRLVSIQLGNDYSGLWTIYLLGVPLQVLEVLWVFFRFLFRKSKRQETVSTLHSETQEPEEKTE